jgi:hypothetical protein
VMMKLVPTTLQQLFTIKRKVKRRPLDFNNYLLLKKIKKLKDEGVNFTVAQRIVNCEFFSSKWEKFTN